MSECRVEFISKCIARASAVSASAGPGLRDFESRIIDDAEEFFPGVVGGTSECTGRSMDPAAGSLGEGDEVGDRLRSFLKLKGGGDISNASLKSD